MFPAHIRFTRSQSKEEMLRQAGDLQGIEPEYYDIWGHRRQTSLDLYRAILSAMGFPEKPGLLAETVLDSLSAKWSRLLPPVIVAARQDGTISIPVRYRRDQAPGPCRITIHCENGSSFQFKVEPGNEKPVRSAAIDGGEFVEVAIKAPHEIPTGYHSLRIEPEQDPEQAWQARLIVAPEQAYLPPAIQNSGRIAGIGVHLPGLRSGRNWGCGDFTDLLPLIDWAVEEANLAYIALNPLHALHNRQPYNTSPYLPISIFYRNILYIDPERVEEVHQGRAGRTLKSDRLQNELRELRTSEFVEYERVQAAKLRVLRPAFVTYLQEHWERKTERNRSFHQYIEREGELLEQFARFCALDRFLHRRHPDVWIWTEWPEPYQDPSSAAVQEFARRHWKEILFHKWLQWIADQQLEAAQAHAMQRGMPVGLYHDLALATDRYGADLWAHRSLFVTGCRVGAPPDGFSPSGQDWSFPPPDTDRYQESGYELFIRSIRNNCRHGGALRMDHVMRFFRLYWIPEGMTAKDGAYVREPYQDYLRILALESERNQVLLVGEDLGTVAPHVRDALLEYRILSYRLLYFERHSNGAFLQPSEYSRNALCATTTHDLPTLAGFWAGRDIEARAAAGVFSNEEARQSAIQSRIEERQQLLNAFFEAGLLPEDLPRDATTIPELTPELHSAAVGYLALTPCRLFLVNQEDLTQEAEQQNLPGTTSEHPNWRRKTRFQLEEMRSDSMVQACTRMLRDWLERTGRLWKT